MATSVKKYVTIAGLSDRIMIPRLGRIRLGHVDHNTQSNKTSPKEDPFFHVPKEVAEVYGETPTELDIMFPVNDRGIIFPQAYRYFGSSKRLLCSGNGQEGQRFNSSTLKTELCACPCNLLGNGCRERANLMVMLPKVRNQGGVYQIDTGSIHAIIAINSTLNILSPEDNPDSGMLGYFAMVPMKLRRVPRDIYPNGIHRKSYPLQLSLQANDEEIAVLRSRKEEILSKTRCWTVEDPEEENPEMDPGAIVTIDDQPLGTPTTPSYAPMLSQAVQDSGGSTKTEQTEAASSTTQPVESGTTPLATTAPPAGNAPALPSSAAPGTVPPKAVATHSTEPSAPPTHTKPTGAAPVSGTSDQGKPTPSRPAAQASASPLSMTLTKPQLERILSKTRGIKIPDDVVRTMTATLSKREASDLIGRLDKQDYSFFERTEVKEVPVPISA